MLHWYYIKVKQIYNTLTLSCKRSKEVSPTCPKMKKIVAGRYRFSVKLINCIGLD